MSCACPPNYEAGPVPISDYESTAQPNWCSGCGNYGIWAALKRALVELEIPPHKVVLCNDVGCNGNMSDKIRGYRLHSLHGRVLPLATGVKLANKDLHVIAMAGDGATYSEGINHFVNSFRNNFPITFLVHDNGNYGLTTGQASATTPQGAVRNSNPEGPTASTLSPLQLALSLKPHYVAQGFSGKIKELTEIIREAITNQNNGFSYVNILQACPTYNKQTTHQWYQSRIRSISEVPCYDPRDINFARSHAEIGEEVYTGLIYHNPDQPEYLNRLSQRHTEHYANSQPVSEVRHFDTSALLEKYK